MEVDENIVLDYLEAEPVPHNEDVADINRLYEQIRGNFVHYHSPNDLAERLWRFTQLIARNNLLRENGKGRIVGMARLVLVVSHNVRTGIIKDVVVREDYENQEIEKELVRQLLRDGLLRLDMAEVTHEKRKYSLDPTTPS